MSDHTLYLINAASIILGFFNCGMAVFLWRMGQRWLPVFIGACGIIGPSAAIASLVLMQ